MAPGPESAAPTEVSGLELTPCKTGGGQGARRPGSSFTERARQLIAGDSAFMEVSLFSFIVFLFFPHKENIL